MTRPPGLLLALATVCFQAQPVDPQAVTIARDACGVPHIFARTDAGVAYGPAWAHAKDNVRTIQQVVLPAKGPLGRELGKRGAAD